MSDLPPLPGLDAPDALFRAATVALARGADGAVLARLSEACRRHPWHAGLGLRRGDALQLAGQAGEAVTAYRAALAIDPSLFEAWYGLGSAQLRLRVFADARDALGKALALVPAAHGAACALAEALFQLGEVDAAVAAYRQAAAGPAEVRAAALSSLATIIPGSPAADHAAVLAARRGWAEAAAARIQPLPQRPPAAGRAVRVGYLSAFFGDRNWMKPVFGVINAHDRSRFEVHMISDGGYPSAEAGYVDHAEDRVWRVRGMPNAELAQRIAAAEIDVLVDLNGYSLVNRLGLLPYRAARRQFGWFNMFATTGMPGLDALIGDGESVMAAEEPFHSEAILRVPGSYLAFSVLYPVPPVARPPCATAGHVTFGCLGSAYKLTGPTLDAWAAILRGAPAARLLIKNPTLDEASCRADLLRRFSARGVEAGRLSFSGRSEHFAFLQQYDEVDIALDTFPYNGGTTTTEALWQGVPVLTTAGDRWAGRTSRSILVAAGLGGWVARDLDGFVAEGIRLARDPATPAALTALRSGMRAGLAASPVCDSAGLCRALEAIYLG